MSPPVHRLATFALVAPLLAAACGAPPPPDRPLLDAATSPDVLVEADRLDPPPSPSGNRHLTAWWPHGRGKGARLTPARPGARLEIVHLAARERRLVLRLAVREGPTEPGIRVRAAGRDLGLFPVAREVEIPLPADLPLGRVPIDLVTDPTLLAIDDVAVSPALPAGEARLEGGDLVQSGDSLVDVPLRAAPGDRLVGRFVPPGEPLEGQRFSLRVDAFDGGGELAWEWPGGALAALRGEGFEVPLPAGGDGFARVRLLARGEGPSGRWTGLGVVSGGAAPAPADSRESVPETPAAVPPEAPRVVVLYVLDALRADHVTHLGGPDGATPVIDRLAAEGATFTRHFTVAPNTMPSTKTLFTGQVYLRQGNWALPADGPTTLAERFAAAGYRTGLFSGNGWLSHDRGLARGFERAPRRLLWNPSRGARIGYNDNAEQCHRAALEWLDGIGPDERAFVMVQTIHPHNPYDPPEPFRSRFTAGIDSAIDGSTETLLDIKHRRRRVDAADRARIAGLYTGGLAYNDAELEGFLAAVGERYPPGEVLVIVTSDHGDELFDHGGVLHGYTLYDEQVHIPLVVRWPGVVPPARLDLGTDNSDLHATLASLVDPAFEPAAGEPLWPALTGGDQAGRDVHFAAASAVDGGVFMARSASTKVIWAPKAGRQWGMGQGLGRGRDVEYVFDLEADPGEQTNLAGELLPEAAWLRSLLFAWIELGEAAQAAAAAEDMAVDATTLESLKALGYVD